VHASSMQSVAWAAVAARQRGTADARSLRVCARRRCFRPSGAFTAALSLLVRPSALSYLACMHPDAVFQEQAVAAAAHARKRAHPRCHNPDAPNNNHSNALKVTGIWANTIGLESEMGGNTAIEDSLNAPGKAHGSRKDKQQRAQELISAGESHTVAGLKMPAACAFPASYPSTPLNHPPPPPSSTPHNCTTPRSRLPARRDRLRRP